ncbi:MAG: GIY-YIG nuclease family protein [Verrucomicrobiaceae bacterium]|nr:GIY-YIG nuclease family protein [Verrucomicrobiaceae bacterium]
MSTPKCSWPISAKQTLEFEIYDSNDGWHKVGGIYIFSYQQKAGSWIALYVGQTKDFSERPATHDRLDEAVRLGATHIHARVVSLQADRDRIEAALIQYLQPPMNSQLR